MITSNSPVSFMAINATAYKNKSDTTGTEIQVPDGQSLMITAENGKYTFSTDPSKAYASYIINRVDNGSTIINRIKNNTSTDTAKSTGCDATKTAVFSVIESLKDRIININDFIHNNPETGNKEFKACDI